MVVLFIWEVLKIPRIIVKTGYIKGKAHKEYYVQYIATREGVEKYKSDHGDKPATTKQKQLISQLMKDYPEAKKTVSYTHLMLAVYFEQNVTSDQFEDYEGMRWYPNDIEESI